MDVVANAIIIVVVVDAVVVVVVCSVSHYCYGHINRKSCVCMCVVREHIMRVEKVVVDRDSFFSSFISSLGRTLSRLVGCWLAGWLGR